MVRVIDEQGLGLARVSTGYIGLALKRGEVTPTDTPDVFRVTPATLVPLSPAARRRLWLARNAK